MFPEIREFLEIRISGFASNPGSPDCRVFRKSGKSALSGFPGNSGTPDFRNFRESPDFRSFRYRAQTSLASVYGNYFCLASGYEILTFSGLRVWNIDIFRPQVSGCRILAFLDLRAQVDQVACFQHFQDSGYETLGVPGLWVWDLIICRPQLSHTVPFRRLWEEATLWCLYFLH